MNDELGDRLKKYEDKTRVSHLTPIIARLDGKNFHNWTKGLDRPFDQDLSNLMIDTTKYLVEQTNALMGYTQSDEITLTWWTDKVESEPYVGGKLQKMVSVLASMCSVFFNGGNRSIWGNKLSDAFFDCRVYNVPTLEEGANVFLWREQDATKNSVSMAAQHYFSHNSLLGMNTKQKQERLFAEVGINWNDYPTAFKRGTFVQRKKIRRTFSAHEIERLPPLHEARKNPDLQIERTEIQVLDMPKFASVINRAEVIYKGAEVQLK